MFPARLFIWNSALSITWQVGIGNVSQDVSLIKRYRLDLVSCTTLTLVWYKFCVEYRPVGYDLRMSGCACAFRFCTPGWQLAANLEWTICRKSSAWEYVCEAVFLLAASVSFAACFLICISTRLKITLQKFVQPPVSPSSAPAGCDRYSSMNPAWPPRCSQLPWNLGCKWLSKWFFFGKLAFGTCDKMGCVSPHWAAVWVKYVGTRLPRYVQAKSRLFFSYSLRLVAAAFAWRLVEYIHSSLSGFESIWSLFIHG